MENIGNSSMNNAAWAGINQLRPATTVPNYSRPQIASPNLDLLSYHSAAPNTFVSIARQNASPVINQPSPYQIPTPELPPVSASGHATRTHSSSCLPMSRGFDTRPNEYIPMPYLNHGSFIPVYDDIGGTSRTPMSGDRRSVSGPSYYGRSDITGRVHPVIASPCTSSMSPILLPPQGSSHLRPPQVTGSREPQARGGYTLSHDYPNQARELQNLYPSTPKVTATHKPSSHKEKETVSNEANENTHHEEGPLPLPYELDYIVQANNQMDAEKEASDIEQEAERKRMEAEREATDFVWVGDTSAYPAESYDDLQLPNCEYRAKAIHVGTPLADPRRPGLHQNPRVGVYALRPRGSKSVQLRIGRGEWSPSQIEREGPMIHFSQVKLNAYFRGMSERQVVLWVRHLLATVPGQNDTLLKWTRELSP
ncbi:hypothetical protein F4779DRAFT_620887 [Xylariaceae sp. FL0662B]|nr:hypothetical protein F4779DRAFT_620887 [Xylariaceae sp. FL0662B]